MQGYLSLVLHAHLPFIRHPEYDDFLEEDWLYEAITETYLPLIDIYDKLIDENIDFRITMSITPTLCSMLADELLKQRYTRHLLKLIDLSEKELIRTKDNHAQHETARMYNQKLTHYRWIFQDKYDSNILNAFKKFQDLGKLEIITCGATHGFLPLMANDEAVNAQIKIAVDSYFNFFGRAPRGIWLPECAYKKGIDKILAKHGIKYFFTESHGLLLAEPQPKNKVYAPIICPESGVAVFGRDEETAQQVWSKDNGYPGDFRYREFYRDLGYDADYEYIQPYLHEDGVRRNVGFKYYKITGPKCALENKQEYYPKDALEVAARHAENFMFNRELQIKHLNGTLGRKPVVVATYDAELFGHWWFEGPDFLNFLFRKIRFDQNVFSMTTPSEYLEQEQNFEVAQPAESSWGANGYFDVWLNGENDWIYRHLHKCEELMIKLTKKYKNADGIVLRALNQATRELLLAQSSDWAFIMTTKTMSEYAVKRTRDHISRFFKLRDAIESGNIDEKMLNDYEKKDNIFPAINYKFYNLS